MTAKPNKIEAIYYQALKRESREEQFAFLNEACTGDANLRSRVEALLRSNDKAGDFLETPPPELVNVVNRPSLSEGPGTVIDSYKLLELIGEGGMAVVYMAEQKRPLRRRVALKIIKLGMDTKQVIARFDAERQALALMNHPNIARVFDAGATETGRPYFVMELVRGVSITQYCDKHKLNTQQRLELFVQVCNAVHHAHQKGIIHRDLKPSNIMVTMNDGRPVPKVIDFGIAKATNQRLTEHTVFTRYAEMIGTPEYMSPEQAEMSELDIDTRTDIYSLGIVLYELLTGALPFDAETLRKAAFGEIQRIIREEEPLRPSTRISSLGENAEEIAARRQTNVAGLTKRLHRELEWIPLKALRKDRSRRYRSVLEFADDIQNYLNGTPLIAGPESTLYRTKKFMQRHRQQVAVITGILAILVVSVCFYINVQHAQVKVDKLTSQIETVKRLFAAQQFHAEGRYQDALTEIETLLQEGESDDSVRLFHAQLLFDLGQPDKAKPLLQSLLEGQPGAAAAAHHLLARVNLGTDPDKAREHRRRAESLRPHTADAYVLSAITAEAPDIMVDRLTKALDMDPANHAARQARAFAFYGSQNFTKMHEDAEVIVALRPEDQFGYALRAFARRQLGEMEKALEDHNRAIKLCQHDAELARYLSQRQETYWRMKDYQSALKDAQHCVSLEPKSLLNRLTLARALFATGQYEAAAREFDVIKQSPSQLWRRWTVEYMVQCMLDMVCEGKSIDIPENLAYAWPFPTLVRSAATYRQVAKKGRRLVGAVGHSTWSPDGKQLAYTSFESGAAENSALDMTPSSSNIKFIIEIMDIETGKRRVLVMRGLSPAWSPDGRYIAYERIPPVFGMGREIWLISAQGGEARRIAQGLHPSWGKDSNRIYYRLDSEKAMYSIDVDDPLAKPQHVLDCPPFPAWPRISPDEQYVAYARAGVLTVVERSSGQKVIEWVVPTGELRSLVQWSPDGTEISLGVYGTDFPCSGLWVYSLKQKRGWHVLDPAGVYCNWSRDRTHIAIDMEYPAHDIWLVETDPNLSTQEALGLHTNRADYIRENWNLYAGSAGEAGPFNQKRILKNLMAMAANQYEYGQFDDALWLLKRLDRLHQTLQKKTHPKIIALSAKALYELGCQDESQAELTRLRRVFAADFRHDEDILCDIEQTLAVTDTLRWAWDQVARGEFEKANDTIRAMEEPVAAHDRGRITESIQSLTRAVARAFWRKSKDLRHHNGASQEVFGCLEQALLADPNCVAALRDLAWLQAVCPEANMRNGICALENARRACELTEWKDSDCLTALAAAYGEAGEFNQAIRWQQKALDGVPEDICAGQHREMLLRLESFQAKKHVRVKRIKPLLAWWTFDHAHGQTLSDASGNGNDAQLMGAAELVPDQIGSALALSRDGDCVECSNESAFDLRDEMALSCWVRAEVSTRIAQPSIIKGGSAWRLFRHYNTKQLAFHCTGLESRRELGLNGQVPVDGGGWHHVVATFDGQRLYLYNNGTLDASALMSGRIATNDKPVRIGAYGKGSGTRSWDGLIDEVRIYSRSLTVDEIKALYEQERAHHVSDKSRAEGRRR